MQRNAFNLVTALAIGILFLGVLYLSVGRDPDQGASRQAVTTLREDLSSFSEDLSNVKKEVSLLREKVTLLGEAQDDLRRQAQSAAAAEGPAEGGAHAPPAAAKAGDGGAQPPAPLAAYGKEMRDYVFALIDEEREQAQQERRRRMEEGRKEFEELSQGPYGDFNVKVNSLSKALSLEENQKNQYYEILKKASGELAELRRKTNWRDESSRTAFGTAQEKLQKEYSASVEALLSPEQLKKYQELPAWTRGIQDANRTFQRLRGPGEEFRGLRGAAGAPRGE